MTQATDVPALEAIAVKLATLQAAVAKPLPRSAVCVDGVSSSAKLSSFKQMKGHDPGYLFPWISYLDLPAILCKHLNSCCDERSCRGGHVISQDS